MKKTKSLLIVTLLFATMLTVLPLYTVNAQTWIWGGDVLSTGEITLGPVLTDGKTYQIVAHGVFWYNVPSNLQADAQYYTTIPSDDWHWDNHLLQDPSFLQVDGQPQDWGPFSNGDTSHTYYLTYTGTGAAITFQIIDQIDSDYSNNYCHINIQIFEIPEEYSGLTPGFWKNHVDLWEGYDPNDKFSVVFGVSITIDLGKKSENSDPTLLEALKAKGGINEDAGIYDALARHAVAALLNAAHPYVNYPMNEGAIIGAVQEAILNTLMDDAEPLKNQLDANNNLGGGIDAHGNPI